MTAALHAAITCSILVAGCTEASKAAAPPGDSVVARIDGVPVLASEVRQHLRAAPPRIGTAPHVDPQRAALDAAIRVRLFATEGRRRGIVAEGAPAIVQATLVRGVIEAETAAPGFRGDGVTDEEARAFYERDPERFNRPTEVRLAAIVVDDLRLAEELLGQAATATEAEFAQLVAAHSADPASRERRGDLGVVDEHGEGFDPHVAGTAMWLKHVGQVGLAAADDGRYYVLRATEVTIVLRPWDADKMRVKNVLGEDRRDEALRQLEERLRRGVRIDVDEGALALVTKSAG